MVFLPNQHSPGRHHRFAQLRLGPDVLVARLVALQPDGQGSAAAPYACAVYASRVFLGGAVGPVHLSALGLVAVDHDASGRIRWLCWKSS